MDLDEQRAQVADRPGACAAAASRASRAPRRRLGARRLGGRASESERNAGEILDDAVVEVGGDPAPLVGGRLDRALRAARSRSPLARARSRRASDHASGTWTSEQHEQADEQRRRTASQIRAARSR